MTSHSIRRPVLVVLGVAALALAAGAFGGPGFLPVDALVELAGADYWLLAAVAVAGAVVSAGALLSGRERHRRQSETPEPERPTAVPAPGDSFDRTVDSWRFLLPGLGTGPRAAVRTRLRDVATDTVARVEDRPRSEARAAVLGGTWTDDPVASAYLAEGRGVSAGLTAGWRARRSARRTAAEIVGLDRRKGADGR